MNLFFNSFHTDCNLTYLFQLSKVDRYTYYKWQLTVKTAKIEQIISLSRIFLSSYEISCSKTTYKGPNCLFILFYASWNAKYVSLKQGQLQWLISALYFSSIYVSLLDSWGLIIFFLCLCKLFASEMRRCLRSYICMNITANVYLVHWMCTRMCVTGWGRGSRGTGAWKPHYAL